MIVQRTFQFAAVFAKRRCEGQLENLLGIFSDSFDLAEHGKLDWPEAPILPRLKLRQQLDGGHRNA